MFLFNQKYVFFGNYERMERVPKLVEWLISIGASIKSVGTCPLHAVIKLCIKASKCQKSLLKIDNLNNIACNVEINFRVNAVCVAPQPCKISVLNLTYSWHE